MESGLKLERIYKIKVIIKNDFTKATESNVRKEKQI